MKSQKYMEILKENRKNTKLIRIPSRLIDNHKNYRFSAYNEFVCSNLSVQETRFRNQGLQLKHFKNYLTASLLEYVISKDRLCVTDRSEDNKHSLCTESLLNDVDIWIDKAEKILNSKPFVCVRCGIRLSESPTESHQCRFTTLMAHICPCGKLFDDHNEYFRHIRPNPHVSVTSKKPFLPLPECNLAGLHWLLTWSDLIAKNQPSGNDFSMKCISCAKIYTNFFAWFTDYSLCIEKEMILCQVCTDVMGCLADNDIPKLKSTFLALEYTPISQINLQSVIGFFINFKYSESLSIDQLMTLMGFDQIFSYELNKRLTTTLKTDNTKEMELKFFKHRSNQLIKFLSEFPQVCQKCYRRYGSSKDKRKSKIRLDHRCKGLRKEEHVCVCTARFHNHESYIYHRLYRCLFLLYTHISLFMVSNRNTHIYSLCNQTCRPLYDLSGLRNHWKTCVDCHMAMFRSCRFCSEDVKTEVTQSDIEQYFIKLIKSKGDVTESEIKTERYIYKEYKVRFCGQFMEKKSHYFYNTNLYCLKSGPPFSFVGLCEAVGPKPLTYITPRKVVKLSDKDK